MSFEISVDVRNPGQFFACCGLFELADRLGGGALARFAGERFMVDGTCSLAEVLDRWTGAPLRQIDAEDDTASPLYLEAPFDLLLDWWKDADSGGRDLKVWAGSMQSVRIMQSMVGALRDLRFHGEDLLDLGCVVYDPSDPTKKVEPFYFDARRAANAHSRDVGFAPNDLGLTTTAFPAVEALCLVGLQRFRPMPHVIHKRLFTYRTWSRALPISIAAPAAAGLISVGHEATYQFEIWFRTGQRKHKAFRPGVLLGKGA